MRLGGYMRVSRKGDRDPDKWLTVPAQRKAIQGWVDAHAGQLVDLREDIDISGAADDRPNLEALVSQIERGELDGLVVAKVDRFSRDLAYGATIARRIERAGGTFAAADDGVVIGPAGRDFGGNDSAHFLFAQLLSMADFFRRRTVQGWRAVRERHVLEQGRHWGWAPPFGYQKGDDGVLETHPENGKILVELFERRAAGEGVSDLTRWLEGIGVRSARGGVPTHRWTMDTLRNRAYLGEARAGELVKPDAHPVLVDEGLFLAAAAQAGKPRRRYKIDEKDGPVLSGLVRCWHCRTVMTGNFSPHRGEQRRVYRCRRRHAHGNCPSPATAAEDALLELIEPMFWRELGHLESQVRSVEDVGRESAELEAAVEKAQRGLEAYRDAEDLAEMDPRMWAQGLKVRQQRVQDARTELEVWRRAQQSMTIDVAGLREAWPDLSPTDRRALLADVIGAVVVYREPGPQKASADRLRGRTAVLSVEDLPGDLPRNGRRPDALRSFPPFDDESVPWVLLGE